jgi:aspartate/methionine/tyrosine aminotransferase
VRAPAGGYYLFPRVLGCDDEEALVLELLEAGVLVHPGYFYGADEGCHLMISCLTERSALTEGLARLVKALLAQPEGRAPSGA